MCYYKVNFWVKLMLHMSQLYGPFKNQTYVAFCAISKCFFGVKLFPHMSQLQGPSKNWIYAASCVFYACLFIVCFEHCLRSQKPIIVLVAQELNILSLQISLFCRLQVAFFVCLGTLLNSKGNSHGIMDHFLPVIFTQDRFEDMECFTPATITKLSKRLLLQ